MFSGLSFFKSKLSKHKQAPSATDDRSLFLNPSPKAPTYNFFEGQHNWLLVLFSRRRRRLNTRKKRNKGNKTKKAPPSATTINVLLCRKTTTFPRRPTLSLPPNRHTTKKRSTEKTTNSKIYRRICGTSNWRHHDLLFICEQRLLHEACETRDNTRNDVASQPTTHTRARSSK